MYRVFEGNAPEVLGYLVNEVVHNVCHSTCFLEKRAQCISCLDRRMLERLINDGRLDDFCDDWPMAKIRKDVFTFLQELAVFVRKELMVMIAEPCDENFGEQIRIAEITSPDVGHC